MTTAQLVDALRRAVEDCQICTGCGGQTLGDLYANPDGPPGCKHCVIAGRCGTEPLYTRLAAIGPVAEQAASHIEDLASAIDDKAATLESAPRVTWTKPDGSANTYRCVPAQNWDAWVETWAVPCAVCGERRCLHDSSVPGPEVIASEPCVKCNGTGLRGYSSCSRCEGRGVQ